MLQLPQKTKPTKPLASLTEAYEYCRDITAEYAKTFYLSTLLIPKQKRKAIWAIYAWCRRTDELVDGLKSQTTTPETLKQWEQQLESVFAGHPWEDADVALVDTLERFPMDIQPFKDMIAGQEMDLYRSRYQTFEELKLYCYRVAGTVGLMSSAVLGLDDRYCTAPWNQNQDHQQADSDAIALGIAMQLTNILRDIGEDTLRGRIYVPLDELNLFNYSEADLFKGVIDERWREFMRFQIQRARDYYNQAEKGICALNPDSRWPVWAALIMYQKILDAIERNEYDVFSKRAFVPNWEKVFYLPIAGLRAQVL